MESGALKQGYQKVISQRNIFLLLSLLLSVSLILMSSLLLKKEVRTLFIPAHGQSFWIEDSQVSPSYLEGMGSFLSELMLNRSSDSAPLRNRALFPHIHPSLSHHLKRAFIEEEKSLKEQGQSYTFSPTTVGTDAKKLHFWIEGDLLTLASKGEQLPKVAERVKRRYSLTFKCEAGRLFLIEFNKEKMG